MPIKSYARRLFLYASTVALVLITGSAQAKVTICNKTDTKVSVAINTWEKEKGLTRVRGWWHIMPGSCVLVYSGDARGVRYFARGTDGTVWREERDIFPLCIRTKAFDREQDRGSHNCPPGFHSETFLDLNAKGADWTQNLIRAPWISKE
jgi:uncharacterized membrane protein